MKIIISLIVTMAMFFGVTTGAMASVDSVSVTTNKVNDKVTVYVKNSDNNSPVTVKLELQKDGKTVSKTSVTVKQDKRVSTSFKLSSSGKYTIKYTVGKKSSKTPSFSK